MCFLFQRSDAANAPSPFKDSTAALWQAFGLHEAASGAPAQLLPDADSGRATRPPSDATANNFEKQDSATPMGCAAPVPPLKRPRRSPHAGLRGRPGRPGRSSIKRSLHVTPGVNLQSQRPGQTRGQAMSSSEESGILPRRHSSSLCVCWLLSYRNCFCCCFSAPRRERWSVSGVPRANSEMYTFYTEMFCFCKYVRDLRF